MMISKVPSGAQRLSASKWSAPRRRRRGRCRLACAQRLSASKWSAQARQKKGSVMGRCSTPFGIEVVGTSVNARAPAIEPGAQRLSASKWSAHYGKPTLDRMEQVLNAFRHRSGRHTPALGRHPPTAMCSTPFGIEVVGTRLHGRGADAQGVLNAFRHRSGRHGLGVGDGAGQCGVLNAFRHRSGRHGCGVGERAPA